MRNDVITEYDGYKMAPLEDTPENRKKAAEALEAAVKHSKELEKKYLKK